MSDVNAAAERKIAKQLIDDCVADVVDRFSGHTRARMSTRHEDAVRACIAAHVHGAFAALHPADDGDAIDEAWLEANGFEPVLPAKWLFTKGRLLWSSYDGLSLTNDLDGDLPWIKTRGQLLRLIAAIG